MFYKFRSKIKIKKEIIALLSLLIITLASTVYYNYTKNKIHQRYERVIENVYFKKTVNHIFKSLEPRFKKILHRVKPNETFNSILESYDIDNKEISIIKNKLSKKVNLNKLTTDQKIYFTIDQTNDSIREFMFQISNKERIILTQDLEKKSFNEEIILTKLKKEIVYKENSILQSLYKSATDQKIPVNTILEFARVYGFQVDFQRDIRKKDKFQVMYEVFIDEKKKNN